MDAGNNTLARALFVALVHRTEGLTKQWTRRTALSAGLALAPEEWREQARDLTQEQTLRLWEAIACGENEAWELFFGRALVYLQGHIAEACLRRTRPRVAGRVLPAPLSFSQLIEEDVAEGVSAEERWRAAQPGMDALRGADLADLRALVERLPERERVAVVLRFWVGAGEDTIAQALGGVTTRTVRNTLRRALKRLPVWYTGAQGEPEAQGAGE
ncbi:MAG TPA: sigma-70 family RNA polymerase sigma factor [Ktedonobacterales bacterium]